MTVNESTTDRVIRLVIAAVLFYFAFTTVSSGLGWTLGIIAAISLFTAATGHCAIYSLFGVSTCPVKPKKG